MKKGERANLICAPAYAYGESGSPPSIPPNSTLKFDVSLNVIMYKYATFNNHMPYKSFFVIIALYQSE